MGTVAFPIAINSIIFIRFTGHLWIPLTKASHAEIRTLCIVSRSTLSWDDMADSLQTIFEIIFLEGLLLYFESNPVFHYQLSSWHLVNIGSDNGLVPNRWQTILFEPIDDLFHWSISVLPGLIGLENTPYPDSKVHGANTGSIWGRQDPGGPHVGPMNFAIWVVSRGIPKPAIRIANDVSTAMQWNSLTNFKSTLTSIDKHIWTIVWHHDMARSCDMDFF